MLAVRLRYYTLVFLLLLALTAVLKQSLEGLDWRVLRTLHSQQVDWPAIFHLVDVKWYRNPATTEDFRRELGRSLRALALAKPARVVVDVSISSLPLALGELAEDIEALKSAGTQVYAAVVVLDPLTGEVKPDYINFHAQDAVYNRLAGYGHTELHVVVGTVWYRPCLPGAVGTSAEGVCVPSLPLSVARDQPGNDQQRRDDQPVVVSIGAASLLAGHVWRLDPTSGKFLRDEAMADRTADALTAFQGGVVIVGNLAYDRIGGRPGPELVGWALAGQLSATGQRTLKLLVQPGWLEGFVFGFSALAVWAFSTLPRKVPQLRLNILAVWGLSLALVLLLLVLTVLALRFTLDTVYPQVTMVALAVLYSVSLAAHRKRMQLRTRAIQEDVSGGAAEAVPEDFDVFISYSRTPKENAAWVRESLYAPLTKAKIDNRPLRVFFDETSIRVGVRWYYSLAVNIQASRCFVAVYTADYLRKDFCNFELNKAAARHVKDTDFTIVQILREPVALPVATDHIQATPAGTPDEMVAKILQALMNPQAHR